MATFRRLCLNKSNYFLISILSPLCNTFFKFARLSGVAFTFTAVSAISSPLDKLSIVMMHCILDAPGTTRSQTSFRLRLIQQAHCQPAPTYRHTHRHTSVRVSVLLIVMLPAAADRRISELRRSSIAIAMIPTSSPSSSAYLRCACTLPFLVPMTKSRLRLMTSTMMTLLATLPSAVTQSTSTVQQA
jgi:hypothetical protein